MLKDGEEDTHEDSGMEEAELQQIPIDGILDLHTFRPSEVGDLVIDYIEECQKRRIGEIRIIHGKWTGQLRRTVHSVLRKSDQVISFILASEDEGGWGATLVTLKAVD
jgi:DNA-nicking Smr family endonuclease